MLLTSAGIRNEILRSALADLVGKPFAAASVAFIPTASAAAAGDHGWFVEDPSRLHGLGWRELDILKPNGLGATKGSFCWHFESRDALVDAAIRR